MTLGDRCYRRCEIPFVSLLDPHARDGPADDQLLDLLGAFEDVVGPAEGSTWCCWVVLSVVFSTFPSIRERSVTARATGF